MESFPSGTGLVDIVNHVNRQPGPWCGADTEPAIDTEPNISKLQDLVAQTCGSPQIPSYLDDYTMIEDTRDDSDTTDDASNDDIDNLIRNTRVSKCGSVVLRTVATLPEGLLLRTATSQRAENRVYATVELTMGANFGPYEGLITKEPVLSRFVGSLSFIHKSDTNFKYGVSGFSYKHVFWKPS